MDTQIFNRFCSLIYRSSGISLGAEKQQLLEGRIQKRLAQLSLATPGEYLKIVETDLSGNELVVLLDAISTNTTYFYRESKHFDILADVLASYRKENRAQVKIWCAASSTGEEPYTLGMLCQENLDLKSQSAAVLATDISMRALQRACEGSYSESAVLKLPQKLRQRYFQEKTKGGVKICEVAPDTRKLVLYKRLNLAQFPYPLRGPLDIIFCRNVMIYFDLAVRQGVINEFSRLLRPGGLLFLSHSENLLGVTHSLGRYDASVFQKRER